MPQKVRLPTGTVYMRPAGSAQPHRKVLFFLPLFTQRWEAGAGGLGGFGDFFTMIGGGGGGCGWGRGGGDGGNEELQEGVFLFVDARHKIAQGGSVMVIPCSQNGVEGGGNN